jgi:23S rRNA U2552 (ribose-2'-O)-methylase RlmE/FtsJ
MNHIVYSLINHKIDNNDLKIQYTNSRINININKKINLLKKQISENNTEWDIYKKITNTYEYIATSFEKNTFSSKKKRIYLSKKKPLSRAYYKMIEMIYFFDIFEEYKNSPIKTFHLAEGPGGFIEASLDYRNNINDIYYGMSIDSNVFLNNNIPGWKKSNYFLKNNKNVKVNPFKTGDLFDTDNIDLIVKNKDFSHNFELVTGDGGFDFSIDYCKQEENAYNLLFSQLIYGLCLQKNNGTYILKIFDTFTISTVEIIYLLSNYYEEVNIFKPNTSRCGNSEKYVICRKFNMEKFKINKNKLIEIYKLIIKNKNGKNIRILNFDLNYEFLSEFKLKNIIISIKQIKNINKTLNLINNRFNKKKVFELKKENIEKCIEWLKKHNIEYNKV